MANDRPVRRSHENHVEVPDENDRCNRHGYGRRVEVHMDRPCDDEVLEESVHRTHRGRGREVEAHAFPYDEEEVEDLDRSQRVGPTLQIRRCDSDDEVDGPFFPIQRDSHRRDDQDWINL